MRREERRHGEGGKVFVDCETLYKYSSVKCRGGAAEGEFHALISPPIISEYMKGRAGVIRDERGREKRAK